MTMITAIRSSMTPVCLLTWRHGWVIALIFTGVLTPQPSTTQIQQRHGQLSTLRTEVAVASQHVDLPVVDDPWPAGRHPGGADRLGHLDPAFHQPQDLRVQPV